MATDLERGATGINVSWEDEEIRRDGPNPPSQDEGSTTSGWRRGSVSRPGSIKSSSSKSQASSAESIDPKEPGPWVLHHHKGNFITEIRKPEHKTAFKRLDDWTMSMKAGELKDDKEKRKSIKWEDRRFRVNFAELLRMQLRKLQITLVENVVEMRYSNRESDKWEEHLRKYVQALQDYEYMSKCSKQTTDPFLVSGERWVDHRILHRAMEKKRDYFMQEHYESVKSIGPWTEDGTTPVGGTRNENMKESEAENFRKRLAIAATGAFFLLAPMWLMVLHRTLYTALVSTTVFVILFGFIMAWYLEGEMDVMSSTAAYAAVLVVFVGLNT